MFLIREGTTVSTPKKVKKYGDKIRMEVILQTVNEINRNKRRYPKALLQESINGVMDRIKEGSFLGELDHPINANPSRQVTVWYKEASHKIKELGWDSNKLVGIIETLVATRNGRTLRDLVIRDNIPIGFSYRAIGDQKLVTEGGKQFYEIKGPLVTITWDSVSHPSHASARIVRVTEDVYRDVHQEARNFFGEEVRIFEENGMICTSEGVCYLPNSFDQLVEKRVIRITDRFKF